jgi:outer membrane lipoprotein-sorting protein
MPATPQPRHSLPRLGAVLAVMAWGMAPGALAAQDDAMGVLERASAAYESVDTICADFRQILEVPLLDQENRGEGVLCQRRPNLFSMRFTDPDGDAVVADGDFFWIYYRSINPEQVLRLPLDPSRGGMDFYREFLERPREKYDAAIEGHEEITGRETVRIRLTPRMERGYRQARVWIDADAGTIRQVEVSEENGNVRTVTLDGIRTHPDVGPETFRFDVPAGVSVIAR